MDEKPITPINTTGKKELAEERAILERYRSKLTVEEQAFCVQVVMGSSMQKAWKIAYNRDGKPGTISRYTNRLMKHERIKKYIQALRMCPMAQTESMFFVTRAEKRKVLAEMIRDEKLKAVDRQGAIKIDNAMVGDDAPQRIEHSGLGALLAKIRDNAAKP